MAPRDTAPTDWQVNYPEVKMRSAHLLRSREWADCAFVFETGAGNAAPSLEAHRLILAMASPVFAAMFYGHVGDKGPVNISDIDQPIFASMLDYIYTDEVEITSTELASDLFRAANKYILVHLERKCINYLLDKLCPQNVCHIYELSCMFNEDELRLKCVEMFSTKTLDILKASSFKDAQLETLKKIYSLDSLNIDSELDLFEALLEYTKKAQFNDNNEYDDAVSVSGSQEDNKDWRHVSQQATNGGAPNEKSTDTADLNTRDCGSADIAKERIIAARQYIPGLIEQIRFLTVTALELANCENLSTLLTESKINALILRILSPTSHEIPEGFSKSQQSRSKVNNNRSSVTIPIEIKNISTVLNPENKQSSKLYSSKILHVRNIPWKIEVSYLKEVKNVSSEHHVDVKWEITDMVVKVECLLKDVLKTWKCVSSCEVEIIRSNLNSSNDIQLKKSSTGNFFNRFSCYPCYRYYHWLSFPWKITDPSLGIVSDDTIHLTVHLTLTEVVLQDVFPGKKEFPSRDREPIQSFKK